MSCCGRQQYSNDRETPPPARTLIAPEGGGLESVGAAKRDHRPPIQEIQLGVDGALCRSNVSCELGIARGAGCAQANLRVAFIHRSGVCQKRPAATIEGVAPADPNIRRRHIEMRLTAQRANLRSGIGIAVDRVGAAHGRGRRRRNLVLIDIHARVERKIPVKRIVRQNDRDRAKTKVRIEIGVVGRKMGIVLKPRQADTQVQCARHNLGRNPPADTLSPDAGAHRHGRHRDGGVGKTRPSEGRG